MKKIFLVAVLIVCAVPAFSQSRAFDGRVSRKPINFGLRGGINFNTFGADAGRVWDWEERPDKKVHTGWNIGFVFDCPILESLYFQPGVFYKTKGFKYVELTSLYDHKVQGNSQWVQFPLLFSYRYAVKPGIQLEFNLGPYIGIGLAGTVLDIRYNRMDQGASRLRTTPTTRMRRRSTRWIFSETTARTRLESRKAISD